MASLDTSTKRTSAGSLLPCLMTMMSPGIRSNADTLACEPLRITTHWSGSIIPMESITRLVDQSCHALKAAWMSQTAINTQASAKLAFAGGSPRGFQATKTRMPAPSRMLPKPPKKYPVTLPTTPDGGGVILFLPYSPTSRLIWSSERPWLVSTDRRRHSSATSRVCLWILNQLILCKETITARTTLD